MHLEMRSPRLLLRSPVTSSNEGRLDITSPSCESFRSASSDGSGSPLTPTFSARGHARHPSSTSSLSSTPPAYEYAEIARSTGALPDPKQPLPLLEEDPLEKDAEWDGEADDDYLFDTDTVSPCLCDDRACAHQTAPGSYANQRFDNELNSCFPPVLTMGRKKRRSGDSQMNHIANRAQTRLSSLSRRLTDRKSRAAAASAPPTVCSTPVRSPSSCSTSSIRLASTLDLGELPSPIFASCTSDDSAPVSPIDISPKKKIDHQALATTPLLPPMMIATRVNDDTPLQSPLQSPTVASPTWEPSNGSPTTGPQVPGRASPPLSSKQSIASFPSRPGYLVPSAEIPPIMMADPTDEWAIKLGHANFTIQPEPYVPEVCDAASCRVLFSDWERARRNFVKHQVRAGEHYGITSKTYTLTEQKWAEIDGQWKKNNDIAVARAAEKCDSAVSITPTEPAPLVKLPFLHDPKSEGKFPKLGDEDIVGPMVQIASQIHQRPTRRTTLLRLFGGLKLGDALRRGATEPTIQSP